MGNKHQGANNRDKYKLYHTNPAIGGFNCSKGTVIMFCLVRTIKDIYGFMVWLNLY